MSSHLHAVILAGGSGVRFWPLSRRARPKQFLRLFGDRSLIQSTVDRVEELIPAERTWVVCGEPHAAAVREELPAIPGDQILVEPAARNTAAAIALACHHVSARDPEAILAVLPADHHVEDEETFRLGLEYATGAASAGYIVTLGIQPTRPATGYGWVKRGETLASADSLPTYEVAAFEEKPDEARALALLSSGNYLWNAGIFVFQAGTLLSELDKHLPGVAAPLRSLAGRLDDREALAAAWGEVESISIDKGVMERTRRAACVPVDCGWSDVGSLPAALSLSSGDEAHNHLLGDAFAPESKHCLIHAQGGRPVVVLGGEYLVVVDTPDAVLVAPRDRVEEIRDVVEILEAAGREELL
ncbi:MAG: sugar phosphate nucleotidyltransferase [Deltaproteobacteria bacterium]|nr:sugar phosphate nucleotidyltransferase [Deltaproteobacteria bacterium]